MPTTTYLSITYVTPFDPAYIDLWGTPYNNAVIALDLDAGVKQINQDFNDKILSKPLLKDYGEVVQAVSSASNAITINLQNGNHATTTLTENTTLTITNPSPTGNLCILTWVITQDGTGGRTVTWPASVKWPGGTAPTLTATAGAVDVIALRTTNAGSTWHGIVCGQAYA